MTTRRTLILIATAGLSANALSRFAFAAPLSANDPVVIVKAIYARTAKGKGDGGGAFIIESKAAKAKYLSKAVVALSTKADAHTPKGDVGPVDFDPVTNSQEPDVKSFSVVSDKLEADKAVIAVTIAGGAASREKAADNTIRYNFVRDAGQWKIDDISVASDGEPWSIRGMLAESLKS
jgi:nucleoside diphosphate kinase